MTVALDVGEWSAARPGRTLPPGKTRYPFYRRLGEPQGRSGRAENLIPTGIRSRTVQARSQSLYRLSYPAQQYANRKNIKTLLLLKMNTAQLQSLQQPDLLTMGEKTIPLAWNSYTQHVTSSQPFTRGLYAVASTG